MQIPPEPPLPDNRFPAPYPGQYGSLNPYQQQLQSQNMALTNNGINLQNNLLQTTLKNLWRTHDPDQGDGQPQYQPQPQPYAQPQPQPQPQPPGINIPSMEHDNSMTLNLHLHIDSATASQFSHLARAKSPVQTRGPGLRRSQAREFPRDQGQSPDTMGEASDRPRGVTLEETREQEADEDERRLARLQRAGGSLREPVTSDGEGESRHPGRFDYARARRSIMSMANSPLSGSLLSALSEG